MWGGIGGASVLIAVLAALVVTVITLVNRIERQAGSIVDHLTAAGDRIRPLLDLVAPLDRPRPAWKSELDALPRP